MSAVSEAIDTKKDETIASNTKLGTLAEHTCFLRTPAVLFLRFACYCERSFLGLYFETLALHEILITT
jgi:hypothetical protein